MKDIPVLVPPTWNKTEYSEYLSPVWRAAAVELTEAKNIFIIGYSLPKTDLFFKYLFSIGTINPALRLDRFWVFNPDDKIKERYEEIIGQGLGRSFQFFGGQNGFFSKAVDRIEKDLGLDVLGHDIGL
jgi:hypothetical protein